MRNRIFILVLVLAGCAKLPSETGIEDHSHFSLVVSLPYQDMSRAGIVKEGASFYTKWEEGDIVSINGHTSLPLSKTGMCTPYDAQFEFSDFSPSKGDRLNVIFPGVTSTTGFTIPSKQVYSGSNYCNEASPCWGTAAYPADVSLHNICSVLAFNMTGTKAVTRVTLTAVGGENIAGDFTLGVGKDGSFDGNISGGSSSVLEIELNYVPGTTLYIPVKSVNVSKGFIARMFDASGKHMTLSFFGSGKEMDASKVYSFPSVKFEPSTSDVGFSVTPFTDFQELDLDGSHLDIGTYNILSGSNRTSAGNNTWDSAKSSIASIIYDMKCDIMTLNEMNANDITYLSGMLKDYSWVTKKNYINTQTSENKYQNAPAIIYDSKRLKERYSGIFWLNDPEPTALITHSGRYVYHYEGKEYAAPAGICCVFALFADKKTDREFWWFATHLNIRSTDKDTPYANTAYSLNSVSARSLTAQVKMVLALYPAPFIVAGDMNACPTVYGYDIVLKGEWNEARDIAGLPEDNSGTCPGFNPKGYSYSKTLFIDHIMCDEDKVCVLDYGKVMTKYVNTADGLEYHPSDHVPVKARIIFR